jgi:hypothetical protein
MSSHNIPPMQRLPKDRTLRASDIPEKLTSRETGTTSHTPRPLILSPSKDRPPQADPTTEPVEVAYSQTTQQEQQNSFIRCASGNSLLAHSTPQQLTPRSLGESRGGRSPLWTQIREASASGGRAGRWAPYNLGGTGRETFDLSHPRSNA